MAMYDLDAMFDLILRETRQKSLYYMGFSQGTTIMFAKLSRNPEFASKIRKFFALGPVGTVAHVKGLFRILATKFFFNDKLMRLVFGDKFFAFDYKLAKLTSMLICDKPFLNPLCRDVLFQIAGPESNQFNESRVSVYIGGQGGTSVMNMIHWIQMDSPPIYNLSLVNVPIYLFSGMNDWLANPVDIQESLLSMLPNKSIKRRKQFNDYNHLDFIWGLRAADEIYRPIISIIKMQKE
uniref:AB hydrolase-1 domain-containing protein n=1 Tax=Loa loa TaxID=7209 RepID=A0A1I7VST2_LOALO